MKILMNISFATGYLISMFVHLLFIPLTWQSFGGAFLGIDYIEVERDE